MVIGRGVFTVFGFILILLGTGLLFSLIGLTIAALLKYLRTPPGPRGG
jgi:hypothetical protein